MPKFAVVIPGFGTISLDQAEDGTCTVRTDDNSHTDDAVRLEQLPEHLRNRQIVVIDSVASGNRTHNAYKDSIKPVLDTLKLPYKYIKTTSADTIRDFGAHIDSNPCLVIVISGDTSLNELFNELPEQADLAVLPVPQGTGNAFANSLGLSSTFECLKSLLTGQSLQLPLYQADFSPEADLIDSHGDTIKKVTSLKFFVIGSWALHADLVALSDTAEMRQTYGSDRFRVAAEQILKENPEFIGSISFDDGHSTTLLQPLGPLSYFIATALPRLEATFLISPDSQPSKSELHLLYFKHLDSASTMDIMNQAYNQGAHITHNEVQYVPLGPGQKATLTIDDSMRPDLSKICIDGSIVLMKGLDRTVTFSCLGKRNLSYIR